MDTLRSRGCVYIVYNLDHPVRFRELGDSARGFQLLACKVGASRRIGRGPNECMRDNN